ncbi:hypothetical protein RZS08_01280, partial [Arthrospira platensis SPKY1]|nr:hypothetical protein [Arthrospira platensis SPKY1]
EKAIGELIIGNIDDNGFLQCALEEIASQAGVTIEHVDLVLRIIQSFHPVGVGARSLKECLAIQIQRLGKKDSLAEKIVLEYLDELGKKRYNIIARDLKVSLQTVQKEAEFIATLEPRPGRIF